MGNRQDIIDRLMDLKKSADDYTSAFYDEVIEELKHKRYGLIFDEEKNRERIITECQRRLPTLIKDDSLTIENSGEKNILIEADNYHCLKVLDRYDRGSIDIIYIDPPYNAKNYSFMYKDSFVNHDGSRHDRWLSFMDKRLRLAHGLLKEDGVIFISIDESEQANLKLLCNEIFGEENFLVNMVVTVSINGTQSSTGFAQQHAYCLVYRKSAKFTINPIVLDREDIIDKYNYGEDEKGRYYVERLWKRGVGGRKEDVPTMHFPIWYKEKTEEILIDDEIKDRNEKEYIKIIPYQSKDIHGRWIWSKQKMLEEKDRLILIKAAGKWKLYKKVYEHDDKGRKPRSLINAELGRTELGSRELKQIMNEKTFEYPKYSLFIRYLLNLHPNKDAIVLDFFAGSGTTGQAVLDLNHEDKGRRRFILCTNNENNICEEVTYPRLKTIITGIRKDGSIYSEGRKGSLYYLRSGFEDDFEDDSFMKEDIFSYVERSKP